MSIPTTTHYLPKPFTRAVIWFLLLLTAGGICLGVVDRAVGEHQSVRVSWADNGGLHFSSSSDGPFIITHLIKRSSMGDDAVARLASPIAFLESGRELLPAEDVKKLVWYVPRSNQRATPPTPGATLKAVYLKAHRTKASE